MYEQVFNFNSRPFTSTPYVKHYFPASAMNQAFGQASICIERGSGPVVAIGDIGTGKSLLLAKIESECQSKFQVVNLVCSGFNNRREFLQNILFQLGKPFNMASETELRFAVIESAQPTEGCPHGLLLLVDDAEQLTADIFDEMRTLSNIVVDGAPQVRMVLAGRKSLEELLADPALASFSQRIASRVFLSNLSRDETAAYLIEHINRVGGDGQTMFPSETATKLQELTDGCPRLINQVCDFGLILAGTRGATAVSASLIEEAWNDVQSLPMGSESTPLAAPSQTTGSADAEDNEWTLIEFGQLEDDSPQPEDATVYDFGGANAAEESTVGFSSESEVQPQLSEVAEQQPEEQQPANVTANDDSDLGVDIGSLQAMQEAAVAKQLAETPLDSISSPEELDPEIPAENPSSDATESGSSDEAARIAMEQQLAAVFGSSMPSSTAAVETSDVGPATDAQSTPVLDSTSTAGLTPTINEMPGVPDVGSAIAGGAAGAVFAAGAFAAAGNPFTPETPKSTSVDESFKPATSALNDEMSNDEMSNEEITSVEVTTNVSPAPESSTFTPAFSMEEATGFVPATQPIEETTVEVTSDDQIKSTFSTDETSQTLKDAHEAIANAASPPVSSDPFGEPFAVESTVPIRPTSEIIQQNQNALKISSADLVHVTPIHDPTPDEIVHASTNQTSESKAEVEVGTTDAGAPVGVNWLPIATSGSGDTDAAEMPVQPVSSEPTPASFNESPTAGAKQNEEAAHDAVSESDATGRGFSILTMGESAASFAPSEPVKEIRNNQFCIIGVQAGERAKQFF